jgi:hypothetical protein
LPLGDRESPVFVCNLVEGRVHKKMTGNFLNGSQHPLIRNAFIPYLGNQLFSQTLVPV